MKIKDLRKGQIVTWEYNGHKAIGAIAYDGEAYEAIAVNYFRDSQFDEGDIWLMDEIYVGNDYKTWRIAEDEDISRATDNEINQLLKALKKYSVEYKYDSKNKILYGDFFNPTFKMKVKSFCKNTIEKIKNIWK